MPRKKVDSRVRALIEKGVATNQRSMFFIVGDRARDQVVNLHYVLNKARARTKPNVLWCYKNELGFSTHRTKRMREIKKLVKQGLYNPSRDDPFELFLASNKISWVYYKDSKRILGTTVQMLVLQDFQSLTPNLLARTIETVEGGGVIVMLLHSMSSLKQLYTMAMDVHARYRTEGHGDVVPRFNERFILSLNSCGNCLVVDDELNILPISKKLSKEILLSREAGAKEEDKKAKEELRQLKLSLEDTQPAGSLVALAKTVDQATAVMTFVEAVADKTLRSTVALTAGRGRGKSAALGLAMSGAVAYGYSNIFVTSPSPENLGTLFRFLFQGFDALGYREHADYEAVQSTNPDFKDVVVRVDIFRDHRQTIHYVRPEDVSRLSAQAELVVVDEAAAIPLPLVRGMLGNHLVFLSSTVQGYEGSGRSLSLKLLEKLRRENMADSRVLREVELETPIRYAEGDPIEAWLNRLLCLDATSVKFRVGTPHPDQCELFCVNRDSLFSHHAVSESVLRRIFSILVASHYKNTPNDLQLISDGPAQRLFVLLGPSSASSGETLPDVLCVVQVSLEGEISRESVQAQLRRGVRTAGDLIPWTLSQQFQDSEFAQLSGARIVRIATHPDVTGMGYGSRALDILKSYFKHEMHVVSGDQEDLQVKKEEDVAKNEAEKRKGLLKEKVRPRKHVAPLLQALSDRRPPRLHWLGTAFGATPRLYNFWSTKGYTPVYLRQTANELTGEHSLIMLQPLDPEELHTTAFHTEFSRRCASLLPMAFRKISVKLAVGLLASSSSSSLSLQNESLQNNEGAKCVLQVLSSRDIQRLEAYASNMVDYHMVCDLLPILARLYFVDKAFAFSLSSLQSALLVGMGLQHKTIDDLAEETTLPSGQLLAMFNKAFRKFSRSCKEMLEKQAEEELQLAAPSSTSPLGKTLRQPLEADLEEGAAEVMEKEKDKEKEKKKNKNKNKKKKKNKRKKSLDAGMAMAAAAAGVGAASVPREFKQYAVPQDDAAYANAKKRKF